MLFGYLSNKKIFPDATAVISEEESLSYSVFRDRIDSFTIYYKNTGINFNDKVAILSGNNLKFVISIFSLWQIGAVPVLLNTRLLNAEIFELINFTGCKYLITNLAFEKDAASRIKIIKFPEAEYSSVKVNNGRRKINFEDTAVVIFTSGSTGKPKGVMLSFNNLIESALTGDQVFKHNEGDRWLASLPFYHVGGFSVITRTFLFGSTLILPGSLNIDDIISAIEKYKPALTSFVSTQLKRLLEVGIKRIPELRHILLGGGFLEAGLVEESFKKGWNVSKSYGSTETSSFVTALTKEDFINKRESAGKALYPNQILIVDDLRNPLDSNMIGEVAVKGKSVTKGYINNSEETKRKFSGDIYYTGDYGYLDKEGYLFIEARRNDLIITGGENVNPYEVEIEILKHPSIKEAAVFGLKDEEWGHVVAAGIVLAETKNILLE